MAKRVLIGCPPWMATFADMMALLMSFFVLLFSASELKIEQWELLKGAMREGFGITRDETMQGEDEQSQIDLGTASDTVPTRLPQDPGTVRERLPEELTQAEFVDAERQAMLAREARAEDLQGQVAEAIKEEMGGAGVQVERVGDRVVIRFPNSIAFPSGSSALTTTFRDAIAKLLPVLEQAEGDIVVAGHTDNVPISGGPYGSNWELSAARAASVMELITQDARIPINRLTIEAFGDSKPIAPNATPDGRARNRRVEIAIEMD